MQNSNIIFKMLNASQIAGILNYSLLFLGWSSSEYAC